MLALLHYSTTLYRQFSSIEHLAPVFVTGTPKISFFSVYKFAEQTLFLVHAKRNCFHNL